MRLSLLQALVMVALGLFLTQTLIKILKIRGACTKSSVFQGKFPTFNKTETFL